MLKYLFFYLLLNNFNIGINGENEEYLLRDRLFKNYNKNVRPVVNYNYKLDVSISVAVQNIESFDQIQETIELNVWLRKYWKNDRLKWNTSISNITQLTLDKNNIWTPDIELINAATLPRIYTLNGGMYLYPDGDMLWSMPTVYKISCPLKLKYFPFDTQTCSMIFSSWSYDNSLLKLSTYGDKNTQIDVLDTFSHSEWDLKSYSVETYNETRKCCPNKLFGVNKYNFELKRYTHYYTLNMGMTISLVIVSFIIMMVKPDNLSRTGTAVFIPLTILALQLTIAGKIPVVGYYTLMDIFFLTCFITSMMVSIESGIIYTLITAKTNFLFNIFERLWNFEKIVKQHKDFINKNNIRRSKHSNELSIINEKENNGRDDEDGFRQVETVLNTNVLNNRTKSYTDVVNRKNNDIFGSIVCKNVIKTIEYNNKDLSISFKEYLIFNEITKMAIKIDNFCLVLFPTIFLIMICIIFSYQ